MRMTWVLSGAIAAAAIFAFVGSRRPAKEAEIRDPQRAVTSTTNAVASAQIPASAGSDPTLTGEVLETVGVSKYTYLRLQTLEGEVWAAVPSASVPIHSQVAIANATRMDNFKSSTLGRTFKVVYFGTLGASPAPGAAPAAMALNVPTLGDDQTLPPGHPDIGAPGALAAEGADTLPPGHPDIDAPNANGATSASDTSAQNPPSFGSTSGGAPLLVGDSATASAALPAPPHERASGKNGRLIAEVNAQRRALAGQRLRVRGQVTKVTDVQGRAFFHIRDASPDAQGQPTDLVVTSAIHPTRGDVAVFEGVLRTDVDVGIGYKYPAILADATRVAD